MRKIEDSKLDATKQFYEKNIAKSGALERAALRVELPSRGDRYYAVLDHLNALAASRPACAIELGFGGMANVEWISARVDALEIADLVDRTLGAQAPGNVRFTQCDLNSDFPYPDTTYDLAVAFMVVEHLFDPFHSMREISRILRPGG